MAINKKINDEIFFVLAFFVPHLSHIACYTGYKKMIKESETEELIMGYKVPEDKEQQKQAIERFFEGKRAEKKERFEYFLNIFLNGDENSFDKKTCDDFYKFSRSFRPSRYRIDMKRILKDRNLESFKVGFDKLWSELKRDEYIKESNKRIEEEKKQREMEERQLDMEIEQAEFMEEVEAEQAKLQKSHDKVREELEKKAREAHEAAVNKMEPEKLKDEAEDYFRKLDGAMNLLSSCLDNIDPAGKKSIEIKNNTVKISEAEQKKYENDLKKESDNVESDYEKELEETLKLLSSMKGKPKKYPHEDIFDEAYQKKIEEFEWQIENAKSILHIDYPDLNKELNDKYEKASKEYDNVLASEHANLSSIKDSANNLLSGMKETQKKLEEKKIQLANERKKLLEKNGNDETPKTRDEFTKRQDELNKEQKEFNKQLEEFNKNIKNQVNKYNKIYETEKKNLKEKQSNAYKDAKWEMKNLSFVNFDPSAGYQPFGNVGQKKNMAARELKQIQGDMQAYYRNLFKPMRLKREEISNTLGNINNLTERKWYGAKKKEPQAFTDAKDAVFAYLKDKYDQNKAQKAYDECRNYLSSYMEADGKTLKIGSNIENMRNKGILKILETMEELPEFKRIVNQKNTNEKYASNELGDFEILEKDSGKGSKHTYTKLNFKELEASISKDSAKKNSKSKNKAPVKKEKTIKDLNRQISKNALNK